MLADPQAVGMGLGLNCLAVGLIAPCLLAEERLTPLSLDTQPFADGTTRLVVDWGKRGDLLLREPQEVRKEYDQLLLWLQSPEVVAYVSEETRKAASQERSLARTQASAWLNQFQNGDQAVSTPVVAKRERMVRLPPWMQTMPVDLRRLVIVAMVDIRDDQQVTWAMEQRKSQPATQLFAVGWPSMRRVHQLNAENPALQLQPMPSVPSRPIEKWLADFAIEGLPAVAQADGDQLFIREGL
jgi:hypothetical protein